MAGDLPLTPFGQTDLQVTRLCQGTAFRTLDRSETDPRAEAVLRHCLDVGVRFFDSANAYGWGGSERLLGRALKGAPDDVVVCTKVSPREEDAIDAVVPFTETFLRAAVDRSRQRLGRDVIDLYLLHQPDGATSADELCASMQSLIDAGVIRHWGVSNHDVDMVQGMLRAAAAAGSAPPVGLEDYYTIAGGSLTEDGRSRVRAYRERMLPVVRSAGLGLVAFSPMDRGDLAPGAAVPAGSPLSALCAEIDEVAAALGVGRAELCVAWVAHEGTVTSVLGGAESPAHVDAMIRGLALSLPEPLLRRLTSASERYADALEADARTPSSRPPA